MLDAAEHTGYIVVNRREFLNHGAYMLVQVLDDKEDKMYRW